MFLRRYEPQLYAILRIVAGFLFLWHGTMKLFNFPPSPATPPWHVLVFGGGVEFIGGTLILIGLFTRWAAFIAAGEMAYAFWFAHVPKGGLLPIVNKGELAMLYCFLFLYIAARGAGIWSVDRILRRAENPLLPSH